MARVRLGLLILFVLLTPPLAGSASARSAADGDDRFLAGVASAYLELHFGLTDVPLVVEDGRLWLDPATLGDADPEAVQARLNGLRGLEVVLRPYPGHEQASLQMVDAAAPLPMPGATTEPRLVTGFLPADELMASPLADPRAPSIGGAILSYLDDDDFGTIGRVDFGGSLPLYGFEAAGGLWQVGIEGGVFSIFDLERDSKELINADYLIALPLMARYGDLSGRVRGLHQSSHLGDEFLLRTDIDRINLSYEAIDALLAYDLAPGLRIYGGGGGLIRHSPSDLDPFSLQAGFDYRSPDPVLTHLTYPVLGADVRAYQETDWEPGVSLKGGVELRNGFLSGARVQLLAEYFNGHAPDGQFYAREIEFAGVGLRVLF